MKKKILVMIAAIAAVLVLPVAANAATVEDLTFDKTTGTITDCNKSAAGELVIPAEIDGVRVTSIGSRAFERCFSLTSISIPDGVTSICYHAFYGCYRLTSINIPGSVTSIGYWAFRSTGYYDNDANWKDNVLYIGNCLIEAKETITGDYTIKNGTRLISDTAFSHCYSLTSISIPDSVTSIGVWAFSDCSGLTSVIVNKETHIANVVAA